MFYLREKKIMDSSLLEHWPEGAANIGFSAAVMKAMIIGVV